MEKGYRKGNIVRIRQDGIVQVKLTQGAVALIDADDWERLQGYTWFNWRRPNTNYVRTSIRNGDTQKTLLMHRLILDAPDNLEVDHVDGNGLNNRKSNIRLATRMQNCANITVSREGTSQFKGVSWDTLSGKWKAQISANKKKKHIGLYADELHAARAYNRAAEQAFGEFACLNNLEG